MESGNEGGEGEEGSDVKGGFKLRRGWARVIEGRRG